VIRARYGPVSGLRRAQNAVGSWCSDGARNLPTLTVEHIDDPNDPRLVDYVRLTDADHRRRGDIFLCEGTRVIERAIAAGAELRSLLVTPTKLAVLQPHLDPTEATIFVVDQDVMNAVTGFAIHRGAIAAATRPRQVALDDLLTSQTIAVLEGVNDHENLGALFRNAAAFGVGAVLLDPLTADPFYRRSVRVSLGHVITIPHGRLETWPDGLERVRAAGYDLVALTPSPDALDVAELNRDGKVAFMVGAEGPGLSRSALAAADRLVRIPIAAGVDSVNVATAAAIAFHRRFRAG
jgi:tRNA G18 (ribose-2'-O)-methylase SpoU